MLNDYRSSSPLHQKRPSRSICLPACFSSMSTHPFDVLDSEADYCYSHREGSRRAKTPEIKGRCLSFISIIGGGRNGRRRHASADFHYDASSYALNFEDDTSRADELLLRHAAFPARLSASSAPSATHEKGITGRNHLDGILESDESDSATAAENKAVERRTAHSGGGVSRRRGRGRHSSISVDFSYEPSSYAMNFEDDSNRADQFSPLNGFAGRLAAPPSKTTAPPANSTLRPQIAAFS